MKRVRNQTILPASDVSFPADLARLMRRPPTIRRLNARLMDALAAVPALRLDNLRIRAAQLHLERGYYPRGCGYGQHCHNDVQIELPLSGRFDFQVGETSFSIEPGQALVIAPTRMHAWRCEQPGFMIGATVLVEDMEGTTAVNLLRTKPELAATCIRHVPGSVTWPRLLRMLARPRLAPWGIEETSAFLTFWLIHIFRQYAGHQLGQPGIDGQPETREARLVKMAVSFIRANHARRLEAQEIAHHVGLSTRHLNRLFRRERQESIYHAVLETKLAQAYERLSGSPAPSVKEVAYSSGFSSPSHFSRTFLKRFGRMPSALRQV